MPAWLLDGKRMCSGSRGPKPVEDDTSSKSWLLEGLYNYDVAPSFDSAFRREITALRKAELQKQKQLQDQMAQALQAKMYKEYNASSVLIMNTPSYWTDTTRLTSQYIDAVPAQTVQEPVKTEPEVIEAKDPAEARFKALAEEFE